MIIIEDILSEVVKRVEKNNDRQLFFHYGTLREIVGNLNQLGKASKIKYPIIALIEPFKQRVTDEGTKATLRILIATYTKKTLLADERLELNYKPILFPVYNAFMDELKKESKSSSLDHTIINHFEMGKESLNGYDGTILDDHVDAIEINDLSILFRENKCNELIKNF